MAFLGIKIPEDIASKLKRIDVLGKKEDDLHITLFYFPDKLEIEDISKTIEAVLEISEETNPFEISISEINCFSKGDSGVPIKLEVESPKLIKIRKNLAGLLDEKGVQYSQKWPEFKPHITLSYAEKAIKPIKFKPLKILISELCFWAGDWGPTKMVCTFPLEIQIEKKSVLSKQIIKLAHLSSFFKILV